MIPDTLPALLAQRINYSAPALYDRGRPVPYRELADASRRLAQGLRKLGVRAGDCVALWLPNLPAWLSTFFACAQLGAIAVSVNTRFRSHELADILHRSRARALVFWPEFKGIDFAGILAACDPQALALLKAVVLYGESGAAPPPAVLGKPAHAYAALAAEAPMPESGASPRAGCAIFTTSGTTKAPKFVLHDQQTVIRHAFDVAAGFGIGADSTLLLAPPLCGVFGFCGAMAAIAAGRPFILAPSWDAAQAARDLVAHGVTHMNGTDEACAQMLDCGARLLDPALLRLCRLQPRACGHRAAGRGARAEAGRLVRHERNPGPVRAPGRECARRRARPGRRATRERRGARARARPRGRRAPRRMAPRASSNSSRLRAAWRATTAIRRRRATRSRPTVTTAPATWATRSPTGASST